MLSAASAPAESFIFDSIKQSYQLNISAAERIYLRWYLDPLCCLPADMFYWELCFLDQNNQGTSKILSFVQPLCNHVLLVLVDRSGFHGLLCHTRCTDHVPMNVTPPTKHLKSHKNQQSKILSKLAITIVARTPFTCNLWMWSFKGLVTPQTRLP